MCRYGVDTCDLPSVVGTYLHIPTPCLPHTYTDPEVSHYLLDFMSVVAQCFDADEEFSPQAISNIVNAYAKADMVEEVLPLFEHMALAAQLVRPEEFNGQAVANILNAYAKVSRQLQQFDAQVDKMSLFNHMSAAAQAIDAHNLDMQNIANIMNALAKTYIYDHALLRHLTKGLRANAARQDLSSDSQAMANVMHALATLNHRDGLEELMQDLVPHMVKLPIDASCQAQGIANVCWSAGVLQLRQASLLDWCRRAISARIALMNWSCLRQVQQFLLTLEMDDLLPEGVRISDSLASALTTDAEQLMARHPVDLNRAGKDLPWAELVDVAAICLVRSACLYSLALARDGLAGADKAALLSRDAPRRSSSPRGASSPKGKRTWRDDDHEGPQRRAFRLPEALSAEGTSDELMPAAAGLAAGGRGGGSVGDGMGVGVKVSAIVGGRVDMCLRASAWM